MHPERIGAMTSFSTPNLKRGDTYLVQRQLQNLTFYLRGFKPKTSYFKRTKMKIETPSILYCHILKSNQIHLQCFYKLVAPYNTLSNTTSLSRLTSFNLFLNVTEMTLNWLLARHRTLAAIQLAKAVIPKTGHCKLNSVHAIPPSATPTLLIESNYQILR
jgi:hypothetical protein